MTQRIRKKMVFLILHYNTPDMTRECVASIRSMASAAETAAVIVDNASPDGSGNLLREEYAGDADVTVLLNDRNAGFSEGNNLGYRYIREHYDPDFITVCNNDIVFPDGDYPEAVERIHAGDPFFVLGPDIWNPRLGIHQSPLGEDSPDGKAVRRTILLNRLADSCFPLFWAVIGKRDAEKRFTNRKDSVPDWQKEKDNVPLMGACLVLSREFVEKHRELFAPATFLYYEEYLLFNRCRRNGERMVYRPEIRVLHYEGQATATLSADDRDRYRRMVRNTLAAARIYLADLTRNGKETPKE